MFINRSIRMKPKRKKQGYIKINNAKIVVDVQSNPCQEGLNFYVSHI